MEWYIKKTLAVSAWHATETDGMLLDRLASPPNPEVDVERTQTGWRVHVPLFGLSDRVGDDSCDTRSSGISEAFAWLLEQARQLDCYYLELDSQVDLTPYLPEFEWPTWAKYTEEKHEQWLQDVARYGSTALVGMDGIPDISS